jgi:hypothetical protein
MTRHVSTAELKARVIAIVSPQRTNMANKFLAACKRLKYHAGIRTEWELQNAVHELIEHFVHDHIGLTSEALTKVVMTTHAEMSENDLAALFAEVRPSASDLKTTVFQHTSGVGISIHDYVLDNAYQRLVASEEAVLELLASAPEVPLRSAEVTQRYIAPDTNSLIHFKLISEIEPSDLGLGSPIAWLMLEQVIAELDAKAHHQRAYYSRRAHQLQKLIRAAREDALAFGNGSTATIYFPNAMPAVKGLNLTVADHRILSQAIAFQQEHAGAAVILATSDISLMVRAEDLGLDVLEFPDALRREQEDARDRTIRVLEERISTLESTEPRLSIMLHEGDKPAMVELGRHFTDKELDEIVAVCLREEPRYEEPRYPVEIASFKEVDDYQFQLQAYGSRFRQYARDRLIWERRTTTISPALLNDGVAAEAVAIRIEFRVTASLSESLSKEPAVPTKPARYVSPYDGLLRGGTTSFENVFARPSLDDLKFRGPKITQGEDSVTAEYRLPLIHQRDKIELSTLFLSFEDEEVPEAFEARYEIRAKNSKQVHTGKMIIRLLEVENGDVFDRMMAEAEDANTDPLAKFFEQSHEHSSE